MSGDFALLESDMEFLVAFFHPRSFSCIGQELNSYAYSDISCIASIRVCITAKVVSLALTIDHLVTNSYFWYMIDVLNQHS